MYQNVIAAKYLDTICHLKESQYPVIIEFSYGRTNEWSRPCYYPAFRQYSGFLAAEICPHSAVREPELCLNAEHSSSLITPCWWWRWWCRAFRWTRASRWRTRGWGACARWAPPGRSSSCRSPSTWSPCRITFSPLIQEGPGICGLHLHKHKSLSYSYLGYNRNSRDSKTSPKYVCINELLKFFMTNYLL